VQALQDHLVQHHGVQDHRLVCWLERAVLLVSLLYLCVHTMPRAWGKLNTDFPNYYLSARIAHEGSDTARLYEWVWLQREKDHRALDARLIGLIPITPFSTLFMWPLTGLAALTAKHVWLLVNLALLVPLCWLLRGMTGLSYQRIALVFALSFPLHRNLLYGQFYLLLLLFIVAACWAYLREYYVLAGALVAIAAAAKIFPVLFFIFFLQPRAWRALLSGAVTGMACLSVSVAVFGWNLHRTYWHEILPWTLRGEGLPPYATASASISSVLHYLFLAEPQWNPQPWHNSPLCYALLQPTLQVLALAPAILLIRRQDRTPGRILLEWSALLVASLAISTSPASYNFVLLALPVCVLAALLLQREWYGWLGVLLIIYLGIGFPVSSPTAMVGPKILLYVPRLPLMLALLLGIYLLLWRDQRAEDSSWDWSHSAWTAAMAAALIFSVHSSLHIERAVRQEYAYRLPLHTQALLTANPASQGTEVRDVAFTQSGYHLGWEDQDALSLDPSADDDLSFAGTSVDMWVERGLSPHSAIVNLREPARSVVDHAREPMLSADGQSLAFVRDNAGRGQLMVRPGFHSEAAFEVPLSPLSRNVYEASFLSEKEYAFSAVEDGRPPQIYLTDGMHANAPLSLGESRYPALSPDGRWMAYSHLEDGVWNLWVRDQRTGSTRRLADVPCNQIQPSWEDGSKTLLYGTDCGRSLWFTAVARRRVVP
jgi:Glycosyltransferase family 87/WD40-like Beta Propeller Repeat